MSRCIANRSARGRLVALGLVLVLGCASSGYRVWGSGAKFTGFDPASLNPGGVADFTIVLPLSEIFYQRMTARRFNSLSTYNDPALREFFQSDTAFADYYAAFAEALDQAHFASTRPTAVRLLEMVRLEPRRLKVEIEFRGRNGRPLRWWSSFTSRTDFWEYAEGRWWVIPGKV